MSITRRYRIGLAGFGAMSTNRLGEVVLTPSVKHSPAPQRWAYDAATGQLENGVGRSKCLTVGNLTDFESVTRTPLVVKDCSSDAPDQHWTWVEEVTGAPLKGSFTRGSLKHTATGRCITGELLDKGSLFGKQSLLKLGPCPGDASEPGEWE